MRASAASRCKKRLAQAGRIEAGTGASRAGCAGGSGVQATGIAQWHLITGSRQLHEPYGLVSVGTPTQGPGFTGHVYDAQTGIYYMQQRYYDPVAGRFLSVDPVGPEAATGASFNRYWYANNNPYTFTDPDGRQVQVIYGVTPGQVQAAIGQQMAAKAYTQAVGEAMQAVGHAMPKAAFIQAGAHGNAGNGLMGVAVQASGGLAYSSGITTGTVPVPDVGFVSGGAMGQLGSATTSTPVPTSGNPQFVLGLSTGVDLAVGLTNDPSGPSSGSVLSINTPVGSVQGSYSSESGNWSISVGMPSVGASVSSQEVSTLKKEL
ncbi:RHS repeat-associated core domain-containing protein [Dokdonella sp.]|uniref:RHS repeat-associated core domain-containing protein n=1 Tax=Dokdonella sp. TaxID=2291710 RepID=UPI0025BC03D7|nr:RHS repeat-associated core domain-containing protein [Dokdonella sp.]